MQQNILSAAIQILQNNDRGTYTVPSKQLYPFQWNWDSAIVALGWLSINETRAWQEITSLCSGQWPNGMIPHILFHQKIDSYFPGENIWQGQGPIPSSSISQPPVLASCVRWLAEQTQDKTLMQQQLALLLPQLVNYHLWWYQQRDPDQTGLVVSYHPWESGMDNSPVWDEMLQAVPRVQWDYERQDLKQVDAAQRPSQIEYDRYLYLVEYFARAQADDATLYKNCPYQVYDMGIISLLHRASIDLLVLCDQTQYNPPELRIIKQYIERTSVAVQSLWHEGDGVFYSQNRLTKQDSLTETSAAYLSLFAGFATKAQAMKIVQKIERSLHSAPHGIASTVPHSPQFEPQRYWRGPSWPHINWLIALGCSDYGYDIMAKKLQQITTTLIKQQGFYEYFNSLDGEGCGGPEFSWTAAISLIWCLENG